MGWNSFDFFYSMDPTDTPMEPDTTLRGVKGYGSQGNQKPDARQREATSLSREMHAPDEEGLLLQPWPWLLPEVIVVGIDIGLESTGTYSALNSKGGLENQGSRMSPAVLLGLLLSLLFPATCYQSMRYHY